MQIAIFKNPSIKSSVNGNLKSKVARNGIRCDLRSLPDTLSSKAILRNGQWEEIASDDMMSEKGSTFTLELEDTDTGTSQLISSLKNKKTIEEMVVYEVNPDSEKASYAYYFHKVFVESVRTGIEDGHKVILFDCLCISFRQRTSNNYEPVLWDWNTRTHSYTGSTRI